MVRQTQMNGRDNGSPAAGMSRNLADLLHDLIALAELQWQLVMVDLEEGRSKSIVPLILLVLGAVLGLSTLPVALLTAGWLLVNLAGMSEHAAFSIVTVSGFLLSAGALWIGYRLLSNALNVLGRSRSELQENLRWIKRALEQRGKSTAAAGD